MLETGKSPLALGQLDNRGSHFYIALYWAHALAAQTDDAVVQDVRAHRRSALRPRAEIVDELITVQGRPIDIGGYYRPDFAKATAVMRPSATFNAAIDAI